MLSNPSLSKSLFAIPHICESTPLMLEHFMLQTVA